MRKIVITESQLKNIICNEGFAFEPYYLQNRNGETIKRQKMLYKPNFNVKSARENERQFDLNNLTNVFTIKLNNEMANIISTKKIKVTANNILYIKWGYNQDKGEVSYTINVDNYKPLTFSKIYVPYNSKIKKFYFDNKSNSFIINFKQPISNNSYIKKNGVIKINFEDAISKKLDNNNITYSHNINTEMDNDAYADTRFFNDNQNNKTLDNIKSNVVVLEKSQVKCINLFNFNIASHPQNSTGDKAFKPMKHSVRNIDTKSADPHRIVEPSYKGQKGTEPIVQDRSMQVFYNKIVTYLSWYITKNNINTIIIPQSSSSLTTDIINQTKKKIPNGNLIYSFNDLIVKNPNELKIDMNKTKKFNLNNDEIQDLQYRINLANRKGNYNIKSFSGKERNVLNNLFTINQKYQKYITKVINDKNILVFDDNYATGVTLDETCLQLQQYKPKSIIAITIGEIRKPKDSVRL